MRTLALDIGTVRIGVALSDPGGTIASPLEVFSRGDDPDADARELCELARAHGAERIVVGLPITLRGAAEIAAQQVEGFITRLREHAPCEVVTCDERMTTAIAQRAMLEGDVSRRGRKQRIDAVAATVLLQSYLDGRHRCDVC